MKVAGLIVEYNPFHNGHLYHLEQSKKLTGADCIVCIMSGNFIQRGEPALVNKWARAKMALLSGADLVIELPLVYAMSSAEFFAYGAVSILNSLNIVDYLCFGSESGSIDELDNIADILVWEPQAYKELLKNHINKGISFPSARQKALADYLNIGSASLNILSESNNILAVEYLKALKRTESQITPVTIKRINNTYNTCDLTGNISSATAIRRNFFNLIGAQICGDTSPDTSPEISAEISAALPHTSSTILKSEFEAGRGPIFSQYYENLIICLLRKMDKKEISLLPYVSEGMENRIKNAADSSGSFNELIENILTKRYTKTRIQRVLFSTLTGHTAQELEYFVKGYGPQYIRVLGFNNKGRQLLSKINRKSYLPVITKIADFKNSCNPLFRRMLEIEALSTDMYVLGYSNPKFRKSGQDFTQNIIYVKD